MGKYDSPAFQFYPRDFLSDAKVAAMTNEQVGCYWKLICYCWIETDCPKTSKIWPRSAAPNHSGFELKFGPKSNAVFGVLQGADCFIRDCCRNETRRRKDPIDMFGLAKKAQKSDGISLLLTAR